MSWSYSRNAAGLLSLLVTAALLAPPARAQVDNLARNTKVLEGLEATYQKELAADPNGAAPHWHHANALSQVTFRAAQTAWRYYDLALSKDSLNAAIYQDYAAYLLKNEVYERALRLYDKGLRLQPDNATLKSGRQQAAQKVEWRKEYATLHQLPLTTKAYAAGGENFAQAVDYKKLLPLTTDAASAYHYPKLAARFQQNPAGLSDQEMYMLILGATTQPDFAPYNYQDEETLQDLAAQGKVQELVSQGQQLLNKEPINVLALRELLYAYRKLGDQANVAQTEQRLSRIFDGVLYSGNGSCDKPFVAISPKEEYVFVQCLGLVARSNASQTSCAGLFADEMRVVQRTDPKQQSVVYFTYIPIVLRTLKK